MVSSHLLYTIVRGSRRMKSVTISSFLIIHMCTKWTATDNEFVDFIRSITHVRNSIVSKTCAVMKNKMFELKYTVCYFARRDN